MHWFIVPPLDRPTTGGTVFNRMLIGALAEAGQPCQAAGLEQADVVLASAGPRDVVWVDSLFLAAVPALARRRRRATLGLLVHYLPSLVSVGESLTPAQLRREERAALAAADVFWVPSDFMRACLERLLGEKTARPVVTVEPGRLARNVAHLPEPPVRAVMVANLVRGKGVAELLRWLGEALRAGDPLSLTIVGSEHLDSSYARWCHALATGSRLQGRVRFLGERSPRETQVHLEAGNLFVSASVMESYGMALAEARTLGLPVVARRGGNVAALVDPRSGGELVLDARALASALVALVRDPHEHRRRMRLARDHALGGRPWSAVARELVVEAGRAIAAGPVAAAPAAEAHGA